jgi:hypothetical protein
MSPLFLKDHGEHGVAGSAADDGPGRKLIAWRRGEDDP